MRIRLLRGWESLRSTYWFLPGLICIAAIALAFWTCSLDARLSRREVRQLGVLWTGGPEGARQVLSTIASSMITVAGVIFSITIVALAQASSQFGPRLLRTFMRDTGNQIVLGTFVGTFIYCLLVIRTVHDTENDIFVPQFSVTCALGMAVASLAVLIYFIHHICDSIQAENLVANVGRELLAEIKSRFPEKRVEGSGSPGERGLIMADEFTVTIYAAASGYLQAVDTEKLTHIAEVEDACFRLKCHAGDFVAEGMSVAVCTRPIPPSCTTAVKKAFIVGRRRTPTQDIDFQIHQIVEIGVRALSPSINDPFTAITCIDWLAAALIQVAGRELPSGISKDSSGVVRLILKPPSFEHMFGAAFNQIRQNGATHVSVMIRLLEAFARIIPVVPSPSDVAAIVRHADQVHLDAVHKAEDGVDRDALDAKHEALLKSAEASHSVTNRL